MAKPGIPEGTRDFGPSVVRKRNFIFDTIRSTFVRFGFQPLETPSMENLSTLTGKYGDEGDQLLFKVLNNGDYLKKASDEELQSRDLKGLLPKIAKRGLRYDLTVPFARYVVMNRNQLVFPFKRYQIQPVWRADRPQKGRYREFYQCDADVIGSDSLLYEAELVQIYDQAFRDLKVPVQIKINNRKVLYGIAEAAGITDRFMDMIVAIDKLDKVGMDGVKKELAERGIDPTAVSKIENILEAKTLEGLKPAFTESPTGQEGIAELEQVFNFLPDGSLNNELVFDVTLARGLSYYTGCIFEVSAIGVKIGSIGGGGRYADLTGVFGQPGLSGVGISFGADRIYDVMEALELFPDTLEQSVQVLFAYFDERGQAYSFKNLGVLRDAGIPSEMYPVPGKLKKPFDYAGKRSIPYVIIIGDDEIDSNTLAVKNQQTGEQEKLTVENLIDKLKS